MCIYDKSYYSHYKMLLIPFALYNNENILLSHAFCVTPCDYVLIAFVQKNVNI
jgi:hypothetical protein